MPMTRKDYIVISEILNNHFENYPVEISDFKELVLDFADMFAKDNPRFNEQKFLDAVYGKVNA